MKQQIRVGSIVRSIAGRDVGKVYLVKQIIDKNFVELVDGRSKTLQNPKRKRIKHIENTLLINETIGSKLIDGYKVFDSEIYSALNKGIKID